ncbi:hypothetical protein [Bradyrhizobium sp. AZCC 2289]|uniref:hypothetical protein n=1 Tax=Bradyrhizobium sp. AZCC 2289 TaxID=3117026 RepID=UPI002FF2A63F
MNHQEVDIRLGDLDDVVRQRAPRPYTARSGVSGLWPPLEVDFRPEPMPPSVTKRLVPTNYLKKPDSFSAVVRWSIRLLDLGD